MFINLLITLKFDSFMRLLLFTMKMTIINSEAVSLSEEVVALISHLSFSALKKERNSKLLEVSRLVKRLRVKSSCKPPSQ